MNAEPLTFGPGPLTGRPDPKNVERLAEIFRRVAGTDTPARELIPSHWMQLSPLPTDKPARSPAQLAGTG